MDAKREELEKKFADSLKRAAEIACQIQALEQGSGIPHYDQIEIPAHEVGQQLSRLVQEQQGPRKPATKFPNLRKKMQKVQVKKSSGKKK